MSTRPKYRIQARKSYQFFRMNQDQKRELKKIVDRREQFEEIREATGEESDDALTVLVDLGLDQDSVNLVHLVPLLQVAWADQEIKPREEALLRELAAARGLREGTHAAELFERWLRRKPSDAVFDACDQVAHTMLEHLPEEQREQAVNNLEECCVAVAEMGNGIFGYFHRVGDEERAILNRLHAIFSTHDAGEIDEDDEITEVD